MDEGSRRSRLRLRVGIIFVLIWWLPIWLISPSISDLLGITSESGKHQVFVAMVIIQTVFGIAGVIIASKAVVIPLKKTPYKKMPKTVWYIFKTGQPPLIEAKKIIA